MIKTILLILLALLVSAAIAFYQYLYKVNNKAKLHLLLAFLRFLSFFLLFLLLINPVIKQKEYEVSKTPLPICIDNSLSIPFLKQEGTLKNIVNTLKKSIPLKEQYDVTYYTFDKEIQSDTTITFKGNQTNISQVFDHLKQLYRTQTHPTILLTDGNQTYGNDYVFNNESNTQVLPVILGDTIEHLDLKVNQVNVNKYAFLKNKFPVEIFVNSTGTNKQNATLTIEENKTTIYKQEIVFSENKNSQIITALLPATTTGNHQYKAVLHANVKERNTLNNSKNFVVEVIDQRTEIAIVSNLLHPDLGVLKRALGANEQRKVTVLKPSQINKLNDYQVVILYQPDASFKTLLEQNRALQINIFLITGINTDFNLVAKYFPEFEFKTTTQKENMTAYYASTFSLFAIDKVNFDQFSPLENLFGTITPKGNSTTLLYAKIRGVPTQNPLLCFTENKGNRKVFLFGENIWKWRMENYLVEKTFNKFDVFLDKTIQFLATDVKKKSLIVNHESFYNSGESITISAQFFNKNYEFDSDAQLTIVLKHKQSNKVKVYDFIKGYNDFSVVFDDLEAGNYTFTVKEKRSNTQYQSHFYVVPFESEKQFVNADVGRLKQLAANTHGKHFYPHQVDELIHYLLDNPNYKPVQKEVVKNAPLIEWVWGLAFIVILVSVEWFVRKYNGLL